MSSNCCFTGNSCRVCLFLGEQHKLHNVTSFPKEFVTFLPEPRSQFTRYRSWNSRMYPVWKDGDPRFRNCWFGEAHSSISIKTEML